MKKVIYCLVAIFASIVMIVTLSSSGGSSNPQDSYEQEPPIVKNFFVQKLLTPLSDGSNMIFRVEYYADTSLPQSISIYEGGSHTRTLKDDGVFPDLTADDFTYAMYVTESLTGFISAIQAHESIISNDGGVYDFTGHDGEFIPQHDGNNFDVAAFNNYDEVPIFLPMLNAGNCEQDLLKQNSLFITDLSVVEDQSRTYNVTTPSGNSVGAWTFGTLIKNMVNTAASGVSVNDFLEEWLKTWTVNQKIGTFANGNNPGLTPYFNVEGRGRIRAGLIDPWIIKAWTGGTPPDVQDITNNGWVYYWNLLDETSMLQNAPFKLMAIVNRLDLRGNPMYGGPVDNGGETRFIFTVIDPITGIPPFHDNPTNVYGDQSAGVIDWLGMNVIIEYGNPINNNCDLRDFAQQWYDLSQYTSFPDSDFNDDLQAITDLVTGAGAGGAKNKNESALNHLRTSEKMLEEQFVPQNSDLTNWDTPDWEFRQFSLGNDGYLRPQVVSNSPPDERPGGSTYYSYNHAVNLPLNNLINNGAYYETALVDWIYNDMINPIRVFFGNHNIPEPMLAGSAKMYKEFVHYLGIDWTMAPSYVYPVNYNTTAHDPRPQPKQIRHQLSLNTCQGCHGGETKTNFTHMYPRGYQQSANYWDATPDYVNSNPFLGSLTNTIDNRFGPGFTGFASVGEQVSNAEKTYEFMSPGSHQLNVDFDEKVFNATNQIISPFLTGRKYSDQLGNNWQDDELADNTKEWPIGAAGPLAFLADDQLTGLFIVNDPSNESLATIGNGLANGYGGPFPQLHHRRWKFNDLQRRKQDLCNFLNQNCNFGSIIEIMKGIKFMPLPKGSH